MTRLFEIINDRGGYFIIMNESIPQEEIAVTKIYVPNKRASKYMKQKTYTVKGEMDNSTVIVGDFNNSL